MFVIDAIPLSRGLPSGTLSYRSKKRLPPGTLAYVPLRSKQVPALVVGVSSVVESKASLKAAGFMLRGGELTAVGALPESIIAAAREAAAYHAAPLGAALSALLKDALPSELPDAFHDGSGFKERFIEDAYLKRVDSYREIARTQRAEGKATIIVAPTVIEAERLFSELKGEAAACITGGITGKRRDAAFLSAIRAKGAIIATPAFSWLPVEALGAIILERPSAGGYVFPKRPYLDMRETLRALAKHRKLQIAYGDFPLPLELRPDPGAALKKAPLAPTALIDPREEQKESGFAAVPKEMLDAIVRTHEAGGRSAVLAIRRGYGSAVVCRDCGNLVRDERGVPLSLASAGKTKIFRSADGATKTDADALCATCGSWNLLPLGVGAERVAEEIEKALPGADIVRFDADRIKNAKAAKDAMKRMHEPGSIAVGTEILIPFIDPARPFDFAAIASADSLLALPFWRARERLVRIGLSLRERAKAFQIATRIPEDAAIAAVTDSGEADFFEEEASLRKTLSYPPYGHLLVFHAEGTKSRIDEAAAAIHKTLAPLKAARLGDRAGRRGKLRLSIVAKIKSDAWPDARLSEKLSKLPSAISINLDPESIW